MMQAVELDPYAVLGVDRGASGVEVMRAHRRLAKRHHPDVQRSADATERMRQINAAWQILSNPVRRAGYDHAHRRSGRGQAGHRAASRTGVRPSAPSSAGQWASWPAAANAATTNSHATAAPRVRVVPGPSQRRTEREDADIRDSGWVAVPVGMLMVLIFFIAFAVSGHPTAA